MAGEPPVPQLNQVELARCLGAAVNLSGGQQANPQEVEDAGLRGHVYELQAAVEQLRVQEAQAAAKRAASLEVHQQQVHELMERLAEAQLLGDECAEAEHALQRREEQRAQLEAQHHALEHESRQQEQRLLQTVLQYEASVDELRTVVEAAEQRESSAAPLSWVDREELDTKLVQAQERGRAVVLQQDKWGGCVSAVAWQQLTEKDKLVGGVNSSLVAG